MLLACPAQFRAYVPRLGVRVHSIGGEAFATAIRVPTIDYRYAAREGTLAELAATTLEPALAGIDMRCTPDGAVVCFEVNPMPAFSYYEANAGQPIAAAIARYLAGG